MIGVDYQAIPFDFDLTLAVVLMNADGTIYHRYGNRPSDDPTRWTSIKGLSDLLTTTLDEHRAYEAKRAQPTNKAMAPQPKWRPAVRQPELAAYLGNRPRPDCIHCHTIHDAQQHFARKNKTWKDDDRWVYPEPARIGLVMHDRKQSYIEHVAKDSAAAKAGLEPGDRLLKLGRQPSVLTISDMMWALHGVPASAGTVDATIARGDTEKKVVLNLPADWKSISAREYAWRPFKWGLSPAPGFGGPPLSESAKQEQGIDPKLFAFRVQYLVTWGPKAHRGRAAAKAGIRKGDVVLSFDGKNDFTSIDHFHAWVRLTKKAGDVVAIKLVRRGKEQTVRFKLPR